jgi:hypothetical protein
VRPTKPASLFQSSSGLHCIDRGFCLVNLTEKPVVGAAYTIYSNSAGFSVAKLRTKVAFSAAKTASQPVTTSAWTESVGPYSTTGYKGLFGHVSLDTTTGRFTAPAEGVYLAAANVRLDNADTGWFSGVSCQLVSARSINATF